MIESPNWGQRHSSWTKRSQSCRKPFLTGKLRRRRNWFLRLSDFRNLLLICIPKLQITKNWSRRKMARVAHSMRGLRSSRRSKMKRRMHLSSWGPNTWSKGTSQTDLANRTKTWRSKWGTSKVNLTASRQRRTNTNATTIMKASKMRSCNNSSTQSSRRIRRKMICSKS